MLISCYLEFNVYRLKLCYTFLLSEKIINKLVIQSAADVLELE